MSRTSIWDDEANVVKLRKLWHDPTLSLTDIAEQFGVTREAVKNRAGRDGLPRKPKISPEMRPEWCPQVRVDDAAYVAELLKHGGFPKFAEERFATKPATIGGKRVIADFYRICAPLSWPGRVAA